MYAYAHTPLDEETIKLTGFSSGDKLYAFIRGFYGLKGLPNFFTKQIYIAIHFQLRIFNRSYQNKRKT